MADETTSPSGPDSGETLEAALATAERQVDAAMKSAAALTAQLRKAKAAAKVGQLRDLRKALAAAETTAEALARSTRDVGDGFSIDETQLMSGGAYTKEVLAAAEAAGVAMFEEDDRLLCYPSLLTVVANDLAVEIDKRRERAVRPSVLVGRLATAQQRPPRFNPQPFLDSLRAAYELTVAAEDKKPDAVVRLVDVWAVLTLLPGQAKEYSKQEFARDLYLLDQSGHTTTARSARELRWSASTGTKGAGVLTTVARTGQRQLYWGISFTVVATAVAT